MRVLVVNAGSSSLKLRVLAGEQTVTSRELQASSDGFDHTQLHTFLDGVDVDAVGHRVVHGGTAFTEPVLLDDDVVRRLEDLTDLAPLHQPKSLVGIEAVGAAMPDLPGVACFDTAFHADLPAATATYALPVEWRERWPLRRYGFHGLSHAYAARRAAQVLDQPAADLRVVVCHLGAGSSLCAVAGGRSVDTTMGFTPLEGLVMATRSGTVDPGLVLWLQEHAQMSAREVAETLEHRSGLLGLAGTADMREILEQAGAGSARAALALDVYVHRVVGGVAAMVAALGDLDVLVFTGGVGEHAAEVRARVAARLGFLGVGLDPARNTATEGDSAIGSDSARVATLVVAAREDLEIARGVASALGAARVRSDDRGR